MDTYFKVRAHHGMCLSFFIGKGYSSSFVENMFLKKQYLETEDPLIEIVDIADHICEKCPHNHVGKCISIDKVEQYDKRVLDCCDINRNTIMKWSAFQKTVKEKIINTGVRKDICSNCSWNEICSKIEKAVL